MSLTASRNVRNYLVKNAAITALVPASNISMGWPRELDKFPCILISQSSGIDKGLLGYKTTPAGSRNRREEYSVQLDIFSQKNRRETLAIADAIVPVMIVSGAARKINDSDLYESDLEAFRKTQTFTMTVWHED